MKRNELISAVAIAAVAALALSCQKAPQATPQTREVSFELSLSAPQTKFSVTEGTDFLKAAWEVGDKVAVMWGRESDQYEEFTVTAISNGGKNAVFSNPSSAMPDDCTIGVYYPADGYNAGWKGMTIAYINTTDEDYWTLENACKNLIYGACGITVTGGVVPATNLEQKSSFLYIKKGTRIAGMTERCYFVRCGLHYQFFGGNDTAYMTNNTGDQSGVVTGPDPGIVPYDLYIPFVADGTDQTPKIEVRASGSTVYSKTLPTTALLPGKVYDISGRLDNVASD
ncbi:MAG: hypothetical protein IJK55_01065 [Bacteroidales bacterium]|nr:hypothetical protein [Bacteroidales bacterium]